MDCASKHYKSLICAQTCQQLASHFDVPEDLAYDLGMYHDIGKSFFEQQAGYSQIGAYLISLMDHPYKDVLMFATNHQMCCCSHHRGLNILTQFKSLLSICLPAVNQDLCIRSLALLFVADMINDTVVEDSLISYSNEFIRIMSQESNKETVKRICVQKKCCNDKVVILPLGISGCGKTIFERSVPDATIIECSGEIQTYVNQIADALEDPDIRIVVIDTDQSMKMILDSLPEDAKSIYGSALKIGLYLFSQNQLEGQFPSVNLESGSFNPMEIDIGLGDPEMVSLICKRYLSEIIVPECPPQGPSLKLGLTPYQTIDHFPPGIVTVTQEFNSSRWKIMTLNYLDGHQIFTGPTRDYRGESFALDLSNDTYNLIRGSLPVFPDFQTIIKDPACYPYLKGAWNFRPEWEKMINFSHNYTLKVTPKFDGSLFNLTFIPGNEFDGIPCDHICKHGKLYYGSRGRFIAHGPVRTRITNAIEGSYGSNQVFLQQVENLLERKGLTTSRVTFHFEAIDAIPTSELTVFYGRAWCPLFGFTVFDNTNKKFHLPEPDDIGCVTTVKTFNNWEDVLEYSSQNYEELLNGDEEIEPEGYVVHIYGENGTWLPVKLKYEFYYVAHKPESKFNRERARLIAQDDKFEKLRKRLAKFRNRPSLETLLTDPVSEFISRIPTEYITWDRKTWALYWKKNIDLVNQLGGKIAETVSGHYPYMVDRLRSRPFSVLMKLHNCPIDTQSFIQLLGV